MPKCKHVNVIQTGSRLTKAGYTIRQWKCQDPECGKTWEVKRPGKADTWKWPD